jgi:hypothetical protein
MVGGDNNRREYYRIFYQAPAQPVFQCAQGKFPVNDISEGGFRFSVELGTRLVEKDYLEGTIHFPDKRGSAWVKGRVRRVFDHQVGVQLDADGRIPLPKIIEEQRLLMQRARV